MKYSHCEPYEFIYMCILKLEKIRIWNVRQSNEKSKTMQIYVEKLLAQHSTQKMAAVNWKIKSNALWWNSQRTQIFHVTDFWMHTNKVYFSFLVVKSNQNSSFLNIISHILLHIRCFIGSASSLHDYLWLFMITVIYDMSQILHQYHKLASNSITNFKCNKMSSRPYYGRWWFGRQCI